MKLIKSLERLRPKKSDNRKALNTFFITLLLILVATVLSKGTFFQLSNFKNLLFQNAIIGVIVMGQLLVILTGGIDLSLGSMVGLSTVLVVGFQDYGFILALVLTMVVTMFVGLINGSLITLLKLPPFVVTLGSMLFIFSFSQVVSGGAAVYRGFNGTEISDFLATFNSKTLLGIPYPAVVLLTALLLTQGIMKTSWGRYIFLYGGNSRAAYYSGIPVKKVGVLVYVLAGFFASLGGLLAVARVSEGSPGAGDIYLMDSIAAVVIGGASLTGGMGTVIGAFLGILILGILNNIMNLIGVSPMLQPAVKGIIILIAVYLNSRELSE